MDQPRWKKWLSYLFEWHIESAPSEVNPHLYVSLRHGRYQLSTANAIYSFADLYDNFRDSFYQLDLDRLPGREVLMLGFGLGSVPYMLENLFERSYRYTAVELDESVIDLASRYVIPELEAVVEFVCADAAAFIRQNERAFDMIIMDVFLDDTVPAPCESPEFLAGLDRALRPDGLLLYNRLSRTSEDQEATRAFFTGAFRDQFPRGDYLELDGNRMLLNHPDYRLRK